VSDVTDCIKDLIKKLGKYEIPIYVSDNASTDATSTEIIKLQSEYAFLFYYRNSKNVEADRNFEAVLKLSQTKYAWLLGDDDRISEQHLSEILDRLANNDYEMLVAGYSDDFKVKSKLFSDPKELLVELGTSMTWISVQIWNKKLIEAAPLAKYYDTNFIQFGSIFEKFSREFSGVYFLSKLCIYYSGNTSLQHWEFMRLKVFAKDWCEVVWMLPTFYDDVKSEVILAMGRTNGVYEIKKLLRNREQGEYDYKTYSLYKKYLPHVTKTSIVAFWIVSIIPINLVKIWFGLGKWYGESVRLPLRRLKKMK
jgi:glycosyltransferase involved in cell wall biosynthesis